MSAPVSRFTVVVPTFQAPVDRVARSVSSVQSQHAVLEGRAEVRVVVVGPTSRADSSEIRPTHKANLEVVQAPDSGMYDALASVLADVDGGFVSYLGAGDTFEPQAFSVVLENAPPESEFPWWVTGMIVGRRADGAIVRVNLPYRYRQALFQTGAHAGPLPGIQQESTFWNGAMNQRIDFSSLSQWRLAGDYYLWLTFLRHAEPTIVEAVLGSFLWHDDNKSQDWEGYMREVGMMTHPPTPQQRVFTLGQKALWALPNRWKIVISRARIRRWTWPNGPWV
jgi:hypothetical protein